MWSPVCRRAHRLFIHIHFRTYTSHTHTNLQAGAVNTTFLTSAPPHPHETLTQRVKSCVRNWVWLFLQQLTVSWFHTCIFISLELPFLILYLCLSAACSCTSSPYVIWCNAADGPSCSSSWHEVAMVLRPWIRQTEQKQSGTRIKYTTVK